MKSNNKIIIDLFKRLQKPNANKTERTIDFFRVGRKQGALGVINDLKDIVSQNKSERECYKDILSYIYKEELECQDN